MRKYLLRPVIMVILMIGISFISNAQFGAMRGSNAAQIGAGFTDAGLLINGYFSRNFGTNMRGLFGGGVGFSNISGVKHYAVYVDGIASYALYDVNRGAFKLNGQAGITFAFDVLDTGDSELYDRTVTMNTGAILGVEGEFSVSKFLSFALASNLRYFVKDDFGKVRYQTSIGMRFLIGR